ncbi:MAG TPA: hypothetical protein VNV61_17510 [Steroidobacteraceae bacterium]|jgi:hypothetical protein|nr:hypothetical protein [Steroidobacteraceae bacterium]
MTDHEFLQALESCTLPESQFGHAAHVRAAYLYLRQADFVGALDRMRRAIRNFATHLGKPDRYHETITVAYLALIQQHICERGPSDGWESFTRDNSELLDPNLLTQFYSREQIESAIARKIFLLPRSTSTGYRACA